MSRNQSRVFGNNPELAPPPPQPEATVSAFNFIVPTEAIDLPSKGRYYPEGHPLHNVEMIEIKHMTAKEEDILTSATLLKKGIALDKMLQSIIVDKRIKVEDLLIGDKNALLVKSRIFGYGADYSAKIQCPTCEHTFEHNFNLEELQPKELESAEVAQITDDNTFAITLPKSEMVVEFRLLTSKDETMLTTKKSGGSMDLLKAIVISINEQTDKFYIARALETLPILDASVLKKAYLTIMPDLDMNQDMECPNCTEISSTEVPLNANFFWPNL